MTSQKSFKNNFGFAYRSGLKSNIAVALIQFFIGAKFIVQKLLHYCSIADRTFCHICQALPQTQT